MAVQSDDNRYDRNGSENTLIDWCSAVRQHNQISYLFEKKTAEGPECH